MPIATTHCGANRFNRHDTLIVQNTKTGEILKDSFIGAAPDGEWFSCSRGTYRAKNGQHVCEPLILLGKLEHYAS